MDKNIVLIGFMGSGKTTVGEVLAKDIDYNFIDTDQIIVQNENQSIPTIFDTKGEGYFRECENKAITTVMESRNYVVATGGGIVTLDKNISILKQGIVIYLKATADHIYNNVAGDTNRPLLKVKNPYDTICKMLAKRDEKYKMTSDYIVEVDNKTPLEISNEIAHIIRG